MAYIIKRLEDKHRDKCLEHFLRLDPDSVYLRFCSPLRDDALKNYVSRLNFERDGIFGIFDDELNIIGIGECAISEDKDFAEVGFSVEKTYQGNGLGNKLMKRIVRFAKAMNKHHLEMVCLRTNSISIHLAKKHGLHIQNDYSGESFATIDMENIDPSIENLSEKVDDTIAYYALQQKENLHNWKNGQKLIGQAVGDAMASMIKMMTPKIF